MTRMRTVTEDDVAALADWLGLSFVGDEASAAADRIDTLAGFYTALEEAPIESFGDRNVTDQFTGEAYRPTGDEDPYNAWLQRFELTREGASGPLDGMTIGIKDNMCVRGVEMTGGSRAFEGFVPANHATVVDRLLDAGAEIAGKTNLDEIAFGPTGETSAFGTALNPRDPEHAPGGSSSGSGAAVAAGEVDFALGSDTGGSVRIPASFCGIVGIKPTYGLVPTYGVMELAYSMDHVGVMAPDVETTAIGLAAIADEPRGGQSDYTTTDSASPSDLTIGVEDRFFAKHVSSEVEAAVRQAIADLESAGAEVQEVSIPALEYSRETWWGISTPEFAAMYATDEARLWREGPVEPSLAAAVARVRRTNSRAFGSNIKEMLALGTHLLRDHHGYHYVRAQNLRAVLRQQFSVVLEEVDVLAAPSTPMTALEIGGFDRGTTPPVNWDTHPTDLTGHPSISLPVERDGLPAGLQFMGSWYDEAAVFDAARAYESLS